MLEQVTGDLLAGHGAYRAIQDLPGIGPVLGAVIVAEIGDITRFRPRAAWLLGRADPAALRVRHHGDPRAGHQAGLTGAALGAGRGDPAHPAGSRPRQAQDAIIARRGPQAKNIAKVAAARKLLTYVFYAMRDGRIRRPARQQPPSAA